MSYDCLKTNSPAKQAREYLEILHLAAVETESEVDHALRELLGGGEPLSVDRVKWLLAKKKNENQGEEWYQEVSVKIVDLSDYDQLLWFEEAIAPPPTAPIATAFQMSECQR